jgi:hypothetical protein
VIAGTRDGLTPDWAFREPRIVNRPARPGKGGKNGRKRWKIVYWSHLFGESTSRMK